MFTEHQSVLLRARHHLKRAIPRQHSLLGSSFPDTETTQRRFLEPIHEDLYQVRQDRRSRVTRSGVVRVGAHFLTLDYGPFSAFRLSNFWQSTSHVHFHAVLPLWSHEWMTYYHWLIDVAPRLAAAKKVFGSAVTELGFLFPGELDSYQRETVEALGLPLRSIVNLHATGGVSADTIYAMPLPGWLRIDPRLQILRSYLRIVEEPCRRLYISRGGRRRVENEEGLFAILGRAGFEFVPDVPRSLIQQIKLFAEASYIVAPHGAALSNIIWSAPQTRLLELANSCYAPDYFKTLAFECGVIHQRLTFGVGVSTWTAVANNITVDLGAIRSFLSEGWGI
jgi:Glycosyltransferase 61